jgi:hypothetical protein
MCHCVGMVCLRSSIAMVSVLATSRGLCRHCSWRSDIASPTFHQNPVAVLWELIPLARTCDDPWEAYD